MNFLNQLLIVANQCRRDDFATAHVRAHTHTHTHMGPGTQSIIAHIDVAAAAPNAGQEKRECKERGRELQ